MDVIADVKTIMNAGSFKGIPLSDKELVELGFERIKKDLLSDPQWHKTGFTTIYVDIGGYFIHNFIYKSWGNLIPGNVVLKYVHQLQNLYYGLTGEELTYKSNG